VPEFEVHSSIFTDRSRRFCVIATGRPSFAQGIIRFAMKLTPRPFLFCFKGLRNFARNVSADPAANPDAKNAEEATLRSPEHRFSSYLSPEFLVFE
jgi:hypothetical protein